MMIIRATVAQMSGIIWNVPMYPGNPPGRVIIVGFDVAA